MPVSDILREMKEFRAAYSSDSLTALDGWELAHAITGVGVEMTSGHPVWGASATEPEVTAELAALIEDMGGQVPAQAVGAGPLVTLLLPIAIDLLLKWIERKS